MPVNGRFARVSTSLGGHGVEAGAIALLIAGNVHRHPDFWEQPDVFDPDRFSAAASADRHRYAWLPFGAGPHLCAGVHLARLEMRSLLYAMVEHVETIHIGPARIALNNMLRGLESLPAHFA